MRLMILFGILFGAILLLCSTFVVLLYYNQDKLIFFPEILPEDYSYSFPEPFEEVELKLPDGEKIYGLYFRTTSESKGTVLYFHGNAGSLRTWGSVSEDILSNGWDILITDYRGYGKSRASLTERGLYEDAERWYSYLKNDRGIPENRIVLYGRSIGTGVVVDLSLKTEPRFLILETPYTSMVDLSKIFYPFLPSYFLSFKLDSKSKISKISSPIFIFHGTEDEIVPYSQGRSLYDIAIREGKKAQFIPVAGGSHNDLSVFPEYRKELKRILSH